MHYLGCFARQVGLLVLPVIGQATVEGKAILRRTEAATDRAMKRGIGCEKPQGIDEQSSRRYMICRKLRIGRIIDKAAF